MYWTIIRVTCSDGKFGRFARGVPGGGAKVGGSKIKVEGRRSEVGGRSAEFAARRAEIGGRRKRERTSDSMDSRAQTGYCVGMAAERGKLATVIVLSISYQQLVPTLVQVL